MLEHGYGSAVGRTGSMGTVSNEKADTATHAGERARETGTFVCQVCNAKVRVQQGDRIPECPNGQHKTFDERPDEP